MAVLAHDPFAEWLANPVTPQAVAFERDPFALWLSTHSTTVPQAQVKVSFCPDHYQAEIVGGHPYDLWIY